VFSDDRFRAAYLSTLTGDLAAKVAGAGTGDGTTPPAAHGFGGFNYQLAVDEALDQWADQLEAELDLDQLLTIARSGVS
jgi:hypothetical protein